MINKMSCVLAKDENISISKDAKRKMPNCKSIRFSCTNGIRHKGLLFTYISREEFNRVKRDSPDKAFGDLFLT